MASYHLVFAKKRAHLVPHFLVASLLPILSVASDPPRPPHTHGHQRAPPEIPAISAHGPPSEGCALDLFLLALGAAVRCKSFRHRVHLACAAAVSRPASLHQNLPSTRRSCGALRAYWPGRERAIANSIPRYKAYIAIEGRLVGAFELGGPWQIVGSRLTQHSFLTCSPRSSENLFL